MSCVVSARVAVGMMRMLPNEINAERIYRENFISKKLL